MVLFINGLPLGVIELKNPGDEQATLDGAYNQLQTYTSQIPSLFRTNGVLVISDGLNARIGSLTASRERFMPWRTVDGDEVAPKGAPELETLLKGVLDKHRFLEQLKDFIVFGDTGSGLVKIIAGYHQFHAVRHAVASTLEATRPAGDRKVGVIWHTQGSGKSLLMAFYAGQVIKHPAMETRPWFSSPTAPTSTTSSLPPSACAGPCCARPHNRPKTAHTCVRCSTGPPAASSSRPCRNSPRSRAGAITPSSPRGAT